MEMTTPTRLVRTPHPLTTQGQTSVAVLQQDGETLLALLQRHEVDDKWVVEVGGLPVPAIMWGRVRVYHGQVIECRAAVREDVIRIVAMVALAVYAPYLVTGMGFTAGTFAAAVATTAVMMVGSMVINRLLPPPRAQSMDMASNTVEPTYSLSGGRNSMRMWQPMSLVLGQPYAVFDLAAQPYIWLDASDQYLQQLFHLGINCQSVSNLRIGQTALSSYEGVSLSGVGLPGNSYGYSPYDANNVDTIAGALLDAPNGNGPWVTRTSSPGAVYIQIYTEASLFSTDTTTGGWVQERCDIDIQYAVSGSGNWVNLDTGSYVNVKETYYEDELVIVYENDAYNTVYGPIEKTRWVPSFAPAGRAYLFNSTSKPLRSSFGFAVPLGQYDVRVRKVTANITSTNGQNTVQWIQLKSFQAQTTSFPGQSLLGVSIKASGQLNGAIDELNGILTAKPCPHWNGSSWVTATNRDNGLSNPGTILLAYARGFYDENGRLMAGLGWPDSRIDFDSIKGFTVWCTARGFRFDAHIQEAMSHADLLDAITYAGMGSVCQPDGKIGVQWLADDAPVEGVINMGNIKAKSFSVQYDLNDRADEIEYGYFDRAQGNRWNALRVLAPGVTMPRSTARLSNMGITSEAHAAVLARHSMAQNIYMAKAISFEQDLEHMTYKRGTVLSLSHDMTQWGYSGRVQTVSNVGGVITLGLDDAVPATSPGGGTNKFIGLRLLGEAQFRIFQVAAFSGTARSVTLVGAWPSGVPLPGSVGAGGQVHDALWIFDFKATPGQKVVVAKIEPTAGLKGGKVTVVPLPDEFWPFVNSGAYTPPPNRSLLDAVPVIGGLSMSEVLRRQGSSYFVELSLTINQMVGVDRTEIWGARGNEPPKLLGTIKSSNFDWVGAINDEWYLKAIPINSLGQRGEPRTLYYAVAGLTLPASDVVGLSARIESGGVRVSWEPCPDVDYSKTIIKTGATWATATSVVEKSGTDHLLPFAAAGTHKFWAVHVDTSGNASANPVGTTLTVAAPSAPSAFAMAIGNSGVTANWVAPVPSATQQPLGGVQLSWQSNFSSLLETRSATSIDLGWLFARTYTLYARYVDSAGNIGAVASAHLTVAAPSAPPALAFGFGTANIEASWSEPTVTTNQQPLDRVELSWGGAFASLLDGKKATTTAFGWLTAGTYTLYARYVDAGNNAGAVSQMTLNVLPPAQPAMTSVEPQFNAVTLRWQDAKTSQPIRKYAIYFGEGGTPLSGATLYGAAGADSRSDVLFFRSSGEKVAYIVAEDVAGNLSVPRQVDLSISMPNNFVLATEYYEDWQSSELVNGTIVGGANGQIILPAANGRTWGQRLSNNGWTTAQQKIDAGYPIVLQPVPSSGKHTEQRDLGKVLPTAVVRVTPTLQSSVVGYTATIRIRGSVGNSNTTWQPWLTGNAASISDFRYIEVEYAVTSDGKGFVVLDDLAVKVEISEVTEPAVLVVSAADSSGTVYTCTKPFVDVRSVQATPLNSSNILRLNCVIDDTVSPAKVYVQAWDIYDNRTSGTVSLYITGV